MTKRKRQSERAPKAKAFPVPPRSLGPDDVVAWAVFEREQGGIVFCTHGGDFFVLEARDVVSFLAMMQDEQSALAARRHFGAQKEN